MSAVQSKMVDLGSRAKSFVLYDVISERNLSLEELKSDTATVVMFICNHCPYVKLIYRHLTNFAKGYKAKGISFIAINSNNYLAYPDDSPENMKELAKELDYTFPYLVDDTQDVARSYQAECTPDIFVYNRDLMLVYRGQYDSARPNNGIEVTGKDLGAALDAIISGSPVNPVQIPSIGCNIKWK